VTRQPLLRRRAPLPPLPPLPPQRNASTPLQQAHQRPIPLKQPPPQARPAVPSAGSSVGFDHGGAELEHPRSILISRRRAKWGGRARNKSGRKKAEREAAAAAASARMGHVREHARCVGCYHCYCFYAAAAADQHRDTASRIQGPQRGCCCRSVGLLQPRFPRHAVAPGISGHGRRIGLRIGLRIGARRGWGGNRSGERRGRRCGVPG